MVGWDSYSVGYHGDDGSIYFEGDDPVEETGKSMKTGDVVGVVFDAQQVCSIHTNKQHTTGGEGGTVAEKWLKSKKNLERIQQHHHNL